MIDGSARALVSNRGQRRAPADVDVLMVGAGPQALTVAARWVCDCPSLVHRLLVVDPAGCWMRAWDHQFERQRIEVLRSPGVHHPDPDEMAFVRRHRAAAPVTQVGRLRRPATDEFTQFCRDLAYRTGLSRRVVRGQVVGLRPIEGGGCRLGWEASLDDGGTVRARRVVWAGNPRRVVVPGGVELGGAVVHGVRADLRCISPGARIGVIGGGQTAGQLALGAAQLGAQVALISRGPQRVADLDVDAGWLMEDHLAPFRSIVEPAERRRVVEAARRGSMTADLVEALRASPVHRLCDAGELVVRRRRHGALVGFAGAELEVDLVWLATGSVPDLRCEPALADLAARGAPHVEGWPVLATDLQWVEGVYVVGALAALAVGPAAGNLGGARHAADRMAGLLR